MFTISNYPLSTNLAIFSCAAVVVWYCGSKITNYADEIAQRSGLGHALVGLLLLAGVTSLPEIATSITASINGNAPLAVNNLLGSISMQIAVLAVGDWIIGKRALTSVIPDPIVMLQGALNIVLLGVVAVAITVGDAPIAGAGYWTWGLVVLSLASFWKITEADGNKPWIANTDQDKPDKRVNFSSPNNDSTVILTTKTLTCSVFILIAGFAVASTAGVIAERSGMGASFMGVAFVALTTSLPEMSTVFAAMRRGLYTMAISDILGTNILNIALLFAVDQITDGDPVLSKVGDFAAVGAMIGVIVTGLFMLGLAERRDRAIFNIGIDSVLVLIVYIGGLGLLFTIRGTV